MSETYLGNYIDGRFVPAQGGDRFRSSNPATEGEAVFEACSDAAEVHAAVLAAREALPAWRRASTAERVDALRRVQAALPDHVERIAEAITAEMGKPISEARLEAQSIGGKIDAVVDQLPHVLPAAPPGAPGEQRFHALGVVAVVGPFNFPVHLLNTHVIPALITGNTVVAKPSEVTPLAGQRYAELFDAAGFPRGAFNLVQGLGAVGAALAAHPRVTGLIFTGSYATGRRIREATFDQPYKKVSLELGGRNAAVVLDDADLEQAVREILLGALLTTGQRCTATSRVIATPGIAPALRDRLTEAFARIRPGDPRREETFMGPLATGSQRARYLDLLQMARDEGAKVLVESEALPGGAYVTPSLYAVGGGEAYLREELFGPHVDLETAADEQDAFRRAAASEYGLSASLFSMRREAFERFYDEVPAGVLNFNRSTNGASGLLPFGGVGQSGNWRAAGSLAPRLCTYPVAVMEAKYGSRTASKQLDGQLGGKGEAR